MNVLPITQECRPLPFTNTDLSVEMRLDFRNYILKALEVIDQDASYGVLCCTSGHPLVVLFGIPDLTEFHPFENPPHNVPIMLRCDQIRRGASHAPTTTPTLELPNRWSNRSVVPMDKLYIKMFSIGQSGKYIGCGLGRRALLTLCCHRFP